MKLGHGLYGLIGHHGRMVGIPPNMRPLPSHLSQFGHLTTGLGGVKSSEETLPSDMNIADDVRAWFSIMLGEKDAEGIKQTYAMIHDKYNDSNLFILDDNFCWNDEFDEYQKGEVFKTT
jgi:hypothetical protein